MIDLDKHINIQDLSNYLVYANTPRYLYSKFMRDNGIFDIAKDFSKEDYSTYFKDFLTSKEHSLDEFVKLYAIVFSSIHKERKESIEILSNELLDKIKWGDQLREIILSNQRISNTLYMEIDYKPDLISERKRTLNNTFSNFKINSNEN